MYINKERNSIVHFVRLLCLGLTLPIFAQSVALDLVIEKEFNVFCSTILSKLAISSSYTFLRISTIIVIVSKCLASKKHLSYTRKMPVYN